MQKIFLSFSFFCFCSLANAQNTFEKIIDTLGTGGALCIKETYDGGYVFCASTSNIGGDLIVIKLDSVGTIEWAKQYFGPGAENGVYIEQTPDSGYIVDANYNIGLSGLNWLLRLDMNGDTLWTKTFSSGSGGNFAKQMAVNSTGNIFGLTGYFTPMSTTNLSAYFMASLSNGLLVANKIYNTSPFGTEAYAIDKVFNGGFIISAAYAANSTTSDFYLIRINDYGDTLWTKTYNNSQNDAGLAIQQTADSGFVIAGATYNPLLTHYSLCFFKTNSMGDTLWKKVYYDTVETFANATHQTTDGGYIITGSRLGKVYLVKTNSLGDTLWTREFGGNITSNIGTYVRQTKDGGYIVCGVGAIGSRGGAYIIKTDGNGNILTELNSPELNNQFNLTVFPNPSAGIFTIKTRGMPKQNTTIEVYNITNQCVYSKKRNNIQAEQINLSNEPNGLYMVLLKTKEKVISKKIIIQK